VLLHCLYRLGISPAVAGVLYRRCWQARSQPPGLAVSPAALPIVAGMQKLATIGRLTSWWPRHGGRLGCAQYGHLHSMDTPHHWQQLRTVVHIWMLLLAVVLHKLCTCGVNMLLADAFLSCLGMGRGLCLGHAYRISGSSVGLSPTSIGWAVIQLCIIV